MRDDRTREAPRSGEPLTGGLRSAGGLPVRFRPTEPPEAPFREDSVAWPRRLALGLRVGRSRPGRLVTRRAVRPPQGHLRDHGCGRQPRNRPAVVEPSAGVSSGGVLPGDVRIAVDPKVGLSPLRAHPATVPRERRATIHLPASIVNREDLPNPTVSAVDAPAASDRPRPRGGCPFRLGDPAHVPGRRSVTSGDGAGVYLASTRVGLRTGRG